MKGQIETDASTETDCEKRRNDKQKNNTRKEKLIHKMEDEGIYQEFFPSAMTCT